MPDKLHRRNFLRRLSGASVNAPKRLGVRALMTAGGLFLLLLTFSPTPAQLSHISTPPQGEFQTENPYLRWRWFWYGNKRSNQRSK